MFGVRVDVEFLLNLQLYQASIPEGGEGKRQFSYCPLHIRTLCLERVGSADQPHRADAGKRWRCHHRSISRGRVREWCRSRRPFFLLLREKNYWEA